MVNMETAETADNDIGNEEDRIKEVWSHNLEEEFKNICRVVQVLQGDTRWIGLLLANFRINDFGTSCVSSKSCSIITRS